MLSKKIGVLVFSFMYLALVDAMDWSIVQTYYLTNECMACIIKPIPDTSKTTKWHYENCQDTLRHSWARVVCLFPFIWLISYVKTCNKNVLFVNLICTYVIFIGDQRPKILNTKSKVHSFFKQRLHKYLVFLNWQLMSASSG